MYKGGVTVHWTRRMDQPTHGEQWALLPILEGMDNWLNKERVARFFSLDEKGAKEEPSWWGRGSCHRNKWLEKLREALDSADNEHRLFLNELLQHGLTLQFVIHYGYIYKKPHSNNNNFIHGTMKDHVSWLPFWTTQHKACMWGLGN